MPGKLTWFHRLPGILGVLRGMDTRYLDRQGVGLLRVRKRGAWPSMAGGGNRRVLSLTAAAADDPDAGVGRSDEE